MKLLYDYVMENNIKSISTILVDSDSLSVESKALLQKITKLREGQSVGLIPTLRNRVEKRTEDCCCTFF